jgi:hypothetical protein
MSTVDIEKIKSEMLLKPLNSAEELRDWMITYLDLDFPIGVVYPESTHSPAEAMWRIYELIKTKESASVPQVSMLASRDSYKTLSAAAIEVLCMIHFKISVAHGAAIKSQSEKAIQYVNSFFRKIHKYLEENGWQKESDNKGKIQYITDDGDDVYLRVVVATVAGMNCIHGNTRLNTENGIEKASKVFSDLEKGKSIKLLSFNHKDGTMEYKPIVNAQSNRHKKLLKIKTTKGTITCSPEHKIYIEGKGYIEAQKLVVGDKGIAKRRIDNRISYEKIKKTFEQKGYLLVTKKHDYKNSNQLLDTLCPKGHKCKLSYQKFYNKKNRCGTCKSVGYKDVKELFTINNYDLITGPSEYKNTKQKLKTKCHLGHLYEVSYNRFKYGHRCNTDECNSKSFDIDFVKDYIENSGYTLLTKKYINQKQKLKIVCPNNHVTEVLFTNFYNHNKRCKKCYRPFSKIHQEVVEFIESIYSGKLRINDRETIAPYEIDIYIPDFNLGIEIDGLYWHSSAVKKNAKNINQKKYEAFFKKDIKPFVIFEDEWNYNRDLVKNMIKNRLRIFTKKIRASELKLIKLNKNKDFESFFKKNHIDGHTKSSFAYALVDKENNIFSCMIFRKNSKHKCWEIARFASDSSTQIYGGFGKLINFFRENYKEKLLSYSNNRIGHGNVYKKMGFKETTQTLAPGYFYTDFDTRVFRTKCKRINDVDILEKYPTEEAQALAGIFSQANFGHNRPIYKVWDYGHKKWELYSG